MANADGQLAALNLPYYSKFGTIRMMSCNQYANLLQNPSKVSSGCCMHFMHADAKKPLAKGLMCMSLDPTCHELSMAFIKLAGCNHAFL